MGYILVLGAETEIGRVLAEKYAAAGQDLYLADKSPENLENTREYLSNQYGVDVQSVKFDVLEFYSHRHMYNSLKSLPIAVICAVDYPGEQKRAQKDFLEAKKILDINLTGLVSMLNIVCNDFEENEAGFIIAVSCCANNSNYIYKSAKEGFQSYLTGITERLDRAGVQVITAINSSSGKSMEEFAHDIFIAQQKGKKMVYAPEIKGIKTLIKALPWK